MGKNKKINVKSVYLRPRVINKFKIIYYNFFFSFYEFFYVYCWCDIEIIDGRKNWNIVFYFLHVWSIGNICSFWNLQEFFPFKKLLKKYSFVFVRLEQVLMNWKVILSNINNKLKNVFVWQFKKSLKLKFLNELFSSFLSAAN